MQLSLFIFYFIAAFSAFLLFFISDISSSLFFFLIEVKVTNLPPIVAVLVRLFETDKYKEDDQTLTKSDFILN